METEIATKFKDTDIGLIPEEWEFDSLDNHADVLMGQSPESKFYNNIEGTPFLQGIRTFGEKYPTYDTYTTKVTKLAPGGSVLLSVRAPVGEVNIADRDVCIGRGLMSINSKNNEFIYQLFKAFKDYVVGKETGTVYGSVTREVIAKLKFPFPPQAEQDKISEILSSIDDKIELNRNINNNLEKIAIYLFKQWFVDANDSQKGNWKKRKLGEFFPIKTGKKDANVATEFGVYPFFSCSQNALKTDEYSFDSSSVLLAGNGDFNVKWYEGKFEAYQRTYVLTPHNKELLGFLYYLIKYFLDDITAGHRGSVISFITKGMIENFEVSLPDDDEIIERAKTFYEINQMIDINNKENDNLSKTSDSLLPRLMTGKIRVK